MASQFPIRFGWLSPCIGNRWSDHRPIVVDQAKTILPTVNDHFDSMWIADHFYGFDAKTDPFVEAWTSLTWLAAKFPDVMLCHHVLGHGYRPPALTAKMAATLQVFSENRFMLGIGAGWRGDEYEAYGYDFPKPAVRFAQLEEVVAICRLMWTEDMPSFEGTHYSITEAAAPPLPEVVPPVCIGANGEQIGLPLVGRIADMWHNSSRDPEAWLRKRDIVRASAEAAGRDPGSIETGITIERPLPETDAESEAYVELIGRRREAGVDHFVMDFGNPSSTDPILRFSEQVPTIGIGVQDRLGRGRQTGKALAHVSDAASEPDLRRGRNRDHVARLRTNRATASGSTSPTRRMLRPFARAISMQPGEDGSGPRCRAGSSMTSTGRKLACVTASSSGRKRGSRNQLKTWLALRSYRRATCATEMPGTIACATIRRFSSSGQCRRTRRFRLLITAT